MNQINNKAIKDLAQLGLMNVKIFFRPNDDKRISGGIAGPIHLVLISVWKNTIKIQRSENDKRIFFSNRIDCDFFN